jgi:ribosomal protein S18 acetylase RimI-like enzyme
MPKTFSFKVAKAEDIERIRDLTLRAYEKWVAITPRKPRPMTVDYNESFVTNRFDLLLEGDDLIGLIETVPQDNELMIVNVAVDPAYQGYGFGRCLIQHAETIAQSAALTATRLYTNKLMAENIALYESLGYQFEKETRHDLGTVAVHMVKRVNNILS